MIRRSIYRNGRARRGVALVELAIVLPLLLLLVLGTIEYGWLFLKSQQVTNAARQSARVGARVDADSAAALAAASDALAAGGMGAVTYQINVSPTQLLDLQAGQLFTVQVIVPYNEVGLFNLPLIPTPGQLQASVSMMKEGT